MTKLFFKIGAIMMIAFSCILTSCQDDLSSENNIFNYEEGVDMSKSLGQSCFEFVFPVTIELSDGEQLSVANTTELREAAKNDIETNGREVGRPDLIYPVDVILDGVTQSVNDQESLNEIVEACGGGKGRLRSGKGHRGKGENGKKNSCFNLVYPLTLNFADGSTITVNSKEEAKEAKHAHKEANPDAQDRPQLQFPVTALLEDGTEQVLNSEIELDTLKESCGGKRGGGKGKGQRDRGPKCFSLEYPAAFTFEDGTSVTVDNRQALKEAFRSYKEENPETTQKPQIQYPVTIVFEDGTSQSIANEEDLEAVKDDCASDDSSH